MRPARLLGVAAILLVIAVPLIAADPPVSLSVATAGDPTPGSTVTAKLTVKINDGSMTRGRNPVILRTLELLGIDLAAIPALQRYREWPLRNVAGTVVGEVRAEFELEVL